MAQLLLFTLRDSRVKSTLRSLYQTDNPVTITMSVAGYIHVGPYMYTHILFESHIKSIERGETEEKEKRQKRERNKL